VSKLAAIGERIAAKKAAHDRKTDEWAARLNEIEKKEPRAFAIGDAVIAERGADLAQLESTVPTLSNPWPFGGLCRIAIRLAATG
jgi:hypothetical protein